MMLLRTLFYFFDTNIGVIVGDGIPTMYKRCEKICVYTYIFLLLRFKK